MFLPTDGTLLRLFGGVIALLVTASGLGAGLKRHLTPEMSSNIEARIRAWWVMALVFMVSVTIGPTGSVLLFALLSFFALREFVTLTPTSRADHRVLFWCFFVATPLQYFLIWIGWYGLFSILIPVYMGVFVAVRTALAGDTTRFLQRTATTHWALLVCVYFVGYVPALLMLRLPAGAHAGAGLIFFLVFVVQLSDVLQYVWGKSLGRRHIAPAVSPNKTWEG